MNAFLRIFSVILLLLLGGGGIYGGWMLVTAPSGEKFEWTVEILKNTPFKNFLIPGIILIVVNGILPLAVMVMTLMIHKYYSWLILIQGCMLIGWLSVEILLDRDLFVPEMHYPFYAIGLFLVLISVILIKSSGSKSQNNHKID